MIEINLIYLLNWTVYGWFFGLGIFVAILTCMLVTNFVKWIFSEEANKPKDKRTLYD